MPATVYAFPVERCCSAVPRDPVVAAPATRRRHVWQLPSGTHCPLVGTCLPPAALRALVEGLFGGTSEISDYALHAGVVRECGAPGPVAECIGRALDARHARAIEAIAHLDAPDRLARHWNAALGRGEVAATLWAVLTHPAADDALHEHVLRGLHMAQHAALEAWQTERARAEALAEEVRRLRVASAAARHAPRWRTKVARWLRPA